MQDADLALAIEEAKDGLNAAGPAQGVEPAASGAKGVCNQSV